MSKLVAEKTANSRKWEVYYEDSDLYHINIYLDSKGNWEYVGSVYDLTKDYILEHYGIEIKEVC